MRDLVCRRKKVASKQAYTRAPSQYENVPEQACLVVGLHSRLGGRKYWILCRLLRVAE